MIVGWRAARSMGAGLLLDALDMALWHRGRAGDLGPVQVRTTPANRPWTYSLSYSFATSFAVFDQRAIRSAFHCTRVLVFYFVPQTV